ncbi:MAG: sigma-70 family RNA polymerase sigma factor [Deltaproteobacteria bacterium]|nr:sigma-70 family RNA polymerase sigma factor [Deltaproteobacteria bacterium]
MTTHVSTEVTDLLLAWRNGRQEALAELMEFVYSRLLRIGGAYLKDERADHTLDAAALVHECYLRLVQQERVRWQDRAHFFAVAARLMRRVLLDHARRRESLKRGSEIAKIPLDEAMDSFPIRQPQLIALDQALHDLEAKDSQLSELVVLRYFGGMRKEEVSEVLGISSATVSRRWRTARAWLFEYLSEDG